MCTDYEGVGGGRGWAWGLGVGGGGIKNLYALFNWPIVGQLDITPLLFTTHVSLKSVDVTRNIIMHTGLSGMIW